MLESARQTTSQSDAYKWADAQVSSVRDDPMARLELINRTYLGPTGRAPQHLPFRRAALSFMHWQTDRGVLNALDTELKQPRILRWDVLHLWADCLVIQDLEWREHFYHSGACCQMNIR